jgi:SAM-dependent methyltransferase
MRGAGRILRAVATNQLARYAPGLYVRATRQTGRGARYTETVEDIAAYFRRCVDDYEAMIASTGLAPTQLLADCMLLEYGPGDLPGVALLLLAAGARKVYCIDRFPMVALSDKNVAAIEALRLALSAEQRARFDAAFVVPGVVRSGFRADRLEYVVPPHGDSGLQAEVDIVLSRAVLEHVDDLPRIFADMSAAMRPGALAVHQVDLRSHGLHRVNPLDFLVPSPGLWSLMFSHKGVPNRWRVDRYRDIVGRLPLEVLHLEATTRAHADDVRSVRPDLAEPFRATSDEDLAWLGFWMVLRKREA